MKIKLFNRSFGIYKLMSLPALIVSISMFMILLLNFYQLKGQLQTTAVSQLNRFAVISEKNIDSSISITNSLYSNLTLNTLLTNTDLWSDNCEKGSTELLAIQNNYDLIDSVFIYDQKTTILSAVTEYTRVKNFFQIFMPITTIRQVILTIISFMILRLTPYCRPPM